MTQYVKTCRSLPFDQKSMLFKGVRLISQHSSTDVLSIRCLSNSVHIFLEQLDHLCHRFIARWKDLGTENTAKIGFSVNKLIKISAFRWAVSFYFLLTQNKFGFPLQNNVPFFRPDDSSSMASIPPNPQLYA